MPNYITGGLAEFADPPYTFENLTSATFILDASTQKLNKVCTDFLNAPLGRSASNGFLPGGNNKVILVCSTFPVASALPSLPIGYSRYCEIALMFSVYDQLNDEWSWYVPVLYLDGPRLNVEEWQAELPISLGREVYGLAKTRAEIDLDTGDYHGSLKTIVPGTVSNPITVAPAMTIALCDCASLALDDELAAAEAELLEQPLEPELELEPKKGSKKAGSKRVSEAARAEAAKRKAEATKMLRAKAAKLRAKVDELKAKRDDARHALTRAKNELGRFLEHPEHRKLLQPKDLIEMLWGGDPYGNVGHPSPDTTEELYEKLGFVRKTHRERGRAKKKGRSRAKKKKVALSSLAWDTDAEYEFDFRLLGLRQLHDPDPMKYKQADLQQVVRTQLLFDKLPWSPLQSYCIHVMDSSITALLGIASENSLLPDRVYAYTGANAEFGAAAKIL
jgi:hypothetical protein